MSRDPPIPLFTYKGVMKAVHTLLYDFDERECIYAGTQDGKIHVWDLKTNRQIVSYTVGQETIYAIHLIKVSEGDRTLITQEKSGIYVFWSENVSTNEINLDKTMNMGYTGFCRSVLTADNEYLVCPFNNGRVRLVPLKSHGYEEMKNSAGDNEDGEIMVLKLFKQFLFVVYEAGVIKIWLIDSTTCTNSVKLMSDCPMAFDISDREIEENKFLGYVGSNSDEVLELNIDVSESISIVKKREVRITNPGVSKINIRSDNQLVVLGCWDKRLRLFSCKSLKLLVVLDLHKDVVQDIVFSDKRINSWDCDNLLAAGGCDSRISLWKLYN